MKTIELIEEIKQITSADLDFAEKKLIHLNEDQLNWRPSIDAWSILEVLAHLHEYAKFYHDAFKTKIAKTKFCTPIDEFISSPLGRSAWKSMKLGNARNVKRKFRAMKSYNPTLDNSLVFGNEVDIIRKDLSELLLIIESSKKVNLRKVKIPISISKIVRLRLGDALLFVIYHNERHFQQIKNIIQHPRFPKKK